MQLVLAEEGSRLDPPETLACAQGRQQRLLGRGESERRGDAKTVTVEDRLPEVLRSFEIHKLRADWNEQEREREKVERRRR